jgi:hypothetical protein
MQSKSIPGGLIDIPPETKAGEISAVLMRDLCSSGDSVIGFIEGALDGPFFLCMFMSSDWSDEPDLLGGSFFAKRSGARRIFGPGIHLNWLYC